MPTLDVVTQAENAYASMRKVIEAAGGNTRND